MTTDAITTAELTAADTIDDDSTLKMVRNLRLGMTDKLLENGIPTDKDAFELLHKNLAELDKQAMASKRLSLDQVKTDNNADLARAIAESIFNKPGGKDMFAIDPNTVVDVKIPDPLAEIEGTAKVAPAELTIGDDTRSYNQFMDTSGKDIDERRRRGEISLKDI